MGEPRILVTVPVPVVSNKAVGDTDANRLRTAAGRLDRGYDVGGQSTRTAVAEMLRAVADAVDPDIDARATTGHPVPTLTVLAQRPAWLLTGRCARGGCPEARQMTTTEGDVAKAQAAYRRMLREHGWKVGRGEWGSVLCPEHRDPQPTPGQVRHAERTLRSV